MTELGTTGRRETPWSLAGGPRFYASRPDLDDLRVLADYGLDIHPLGPALGQASGMKMCYAALTKGLSALGTELLLAAADPYRWVGETRLGQERPEARDRSRTMAAIAELAADHTARRAQPV